MADDYDQARPSPPGQALDWLVPPGCTVAVDLAAGTGLFTRALADRVADVIAVEPDDRMRAVLAARSPALHAAAGRGEDIPAGDASADAVFVSSAWHWLDPALAVPEIARVLRDGGRLGVIWTGWDQRSGWVAELGALRRRSRDGERGAGEATPRTRRHREVTLPPGAPFGAAETASFTFTRQLSVEDAVRWLGTYSGVITAPAGQRAAGLAGAREVLARQAGPDGLVTFPMRSSCWRASRLPRAATGR